MPANVVMGTGTVQVGLDIAKLKADLNALKSSSGAMAKGLASAGVIAGKGFVQGLSRSLDPIKPMMARKINDVKAFTRAYQAAAKDMASYEAFDEANEGEDGAGDEANDIFARIIGMGKRAPKYTQVESETGPL